MKVAFLDRDGVINKEKNYLHKIEDWEYTENCIEGLHALASLGFKFIVITNQAGIARGFYKEVDYKKLTDWYVDDLERLGISILDVFHCPHHLEGTVSELSISCECRKPKPGMFERANDNWAIEKEISIMIGDKLTDLKAAQAFGLEKHHCFLVESGHSLSKQDKSQYVTHKDLRSLAFWLKE